MRIGDPSPRRISTCCADASRPLAATLARRGVGMIDHETTQAEQREARPSRADAFVGHSNARASVSHAAREDLEPLEPLESSPIGEYLRRQRMLRGISIEELASLTRIPLRSLQRLERGEFDGETDGFVRGFVRTVAAAIGLDADDTISRMLKEPPLGVWERHQSGRHVKQCLVGAALVVSGLIGFLVMQAGWRLLVGSSVEDLGREIVVWRDPLRSLAEATGAEVDPAGEIAPAPGARIAVLPIPASDSNSDR